MPPLVIVGFVPWLLLCLFSGTVFSFLSLCSISVVVWCCFQFRPLG